jgi:hypothetical protein
MKFRIAQTPDPEDYPLGTVLTLEQAAQLLEYDAREMTVHSRMADAVEDQGLRLEIERESGDWQPTDTMP